jgi:hypothetical protein
MDSITYDIFFRYILPNHIEKGERLIDRPCFKNNPMIQLNLLKLCNLDMMYDFTTFVGRKIIRVDDLNVLALKGTVNKHLAELVHFFDVDNYNANFIEKLVENIYNGEYLLTRSWFKMNVQLHCKIMVLKLLGKDHLINAVCGDFEDELNHLLVIALNYLEQIHSHTHCDDHIMDEKCDDNMDEKCDDDVATQPYNEDDDNDDNNNNNDDKYEIVIKYNTYMNKVYDILKFEELVQVAAKEFKKLNSVDEIEPPHSKQCSIP